MKHEDPAMTPAGLTLGPDVRSAPDLSVVRESDIVVTCTSARHAFLMPELVRPGTFIAAVGADKSDKHEIDPRLYAACLAVVDSLEQAAEIGDLHHALDAGAVTRAHIHASLDAILAGTGRGRTDDRSITLFDSTGMGLQDVAAAVAIYRRAFEIGAGTRLSLTRRRLAMTHTLLRRGLVALGGAFAASSMARAQGGGAMTRIDFETAAVGALPSGVTGALTGSGGPVAWAIVEDPTAPAGPKVLAQTSTDKTDYRFPLAIFAAPVAADIDAAVRFKPIAGQVDRAAGIAIRLSDPNSYYVVRANALEDNVRLYRMVNGRRSQFAGADTKVPSGKWQELRLLARGSRFEVFLDGRSLYSATDTTIAAAGRVALWTKADSVTHFDDLRIQTL
jgi:hypothetical protein